MSYYFLELAAQVLEIYPRQYEEREELERKSGVYDLPLPPSPPKTIDPFWSVGEDFGSLGGIVIQAATGELLMLPMIPSTGE